MTLRPLINIVLLVLLAVVLIGTARAQGDMESTLRDAHARNAELLEEARALVRATNSTKARVAFEAARKLFEQSEELLRQFRFVMASRTISQTRQAILQAINIAKSEAKLEESAHRALERAVSRLDIAKSALEEHGDRDDLPARRLVVDAHSQLERARNHMREHMFGVALQLANASADLSQRATAMLRQDELSPEDVFRAIERTDQVLDRLKDRLDEIRRPRAEHMISEAFEIQGSAKASARAGRYRIAIERTQRARQIALRVLKSMPDGSPRSDRDNAARAIAFTDELLERAKTLSIESGTLSEEDLSDALRTQERAKEEFTRDLYAAALRLTRRARDEVRELLRGVDRPINGATVKNALEKTDNLLRRAADALSEAGPSARAIFQRSKTRQREAWRAFERGELRKSLALTRVARNLAREALSEIDDAG